MGCATADNIDSNKKIKPGVKAGKITGVHDFMLVKEQSRLDAYKVLFLSEDYHFVE